MRLLLLMVFLTIAAACVQPAAPSPAKETPSPPGDKPAAATPSKAAWELQWESTVAEARKEGTFLVLSTQGADQRNAISQAIREKYGITPEFVAGRGGETAEKIASERRAGLYLQDIYIGGLNSAYNLLKPPGFLEPMDKMLILPEVLKPDVWWQGALPWVDSDRTIISSIVLVQKSIAINTEIIGPTEITGWRDLLHPRWKGKIILDDPSVTGTGASVLGVALEVLGADYIRALAKQEVEVTRDRRLLGEWVARGKYPIGLGMNDSTRTELARARVPVKWLTPSDGAHVTAGNGGLAVVSKAPHPNATRLFVNWMLTREGQTVISRAFGNPSARVDVPVDHLDPDVLRREGMKYFNSGTEEYLRGESERLRRFKEIFAASLAR